MNKRVKNAVLIPMNILYKLNPSVTLKLLYRLKTGRRLDLKSPKTYTEKIQWLKLNYKSKLLPICSDKYTARKYVKHCGCENILTKLYWYGDDPSAIPFDDLPDQFVIKVTHGSGFNIICKNKQELDINATTRVLKRWLKEKYLPCYGEWFYGVIKPRIIVEEYLDDGNGSSPKDYKFYCFHGEPKLINVHVNRFTNHKSILFDVNWNPLKNIKMKEVDNSITVEKPAELDELLKYARILSKGFPHVRVDLYIVNSKIYFGELSFTSDAGFVTISPIQTEEIIGEWLKIPPVRGSK
jgi:hypothetical protein